VPEADIEEEDGRRAFWSGMLSFGLVSIPVELLPAHRTSHNVLHRVDANGTRLARRYFCPADEEEVAADNIVRGYELDSGKVVVMTDEELEALAPQKSREIDLRLFVDRHSIDPLYFQRSYFLAPGANSGKAYRLLGAVMERAQRAGIASFVMRDKEYLVAIFADNGLLRAETLRFQAEVRSVGDVGLPKRSSVNSSALARMRRAVAALAANEWDPSELTDPHAAVRELAERKRKQKKDVVVSRGAADQEGPSEVVDLFEVLRQSLAQNDLAAKSSRGSAARRKVGAARQVSTSSRKTRPAKRGARAAASPARPRTPARAASRAAPRRKKAAARRRRGPTRPE
jgi:DNA end-binding protein Ku